uniref:Peroxisomal targeting signal 1 receptor n=1 Tax=Romanomermis culicivorax TaxID=13658 RepID=A0A915I3A9_ROMCU
MSEHSKPLLQSECGEPNPLVHLANKILYSDNFPKERFHQRRTVNNGIVEDFATEYLAVRTQNQSAPSTFDMRILMENISKNQDSYEKIETDNRWSSEYLKSGFPKEKYTSKVSHNMDYVWDNIVFNSDKVGNDLKWSFEYLTDLECKFRSTNMNLDTTTKAMDWFHEYEEFLSRIDRSDNSMASTSVATQLNLETAWNNETNWTEDFIDQYDKMQTSEIREQNIYEFNQENPYNGVSNALAEGKKCHAAGDLINAILYFEEAVQQEPVNAEAWQYLGEAQAENELEIKTIAALTKCLELDPKNTSAMLALATAFTNEYMIDKGCRILFDYTKISYRRTFEIVENVLLRTANDDPEHVDADIQNAMGVLYHMSGDLDKAADCFRTALTVKPQDARLWNRLGATLANSQNSTDAIHAYRKALELYPAFVRARYNLGVSCLNLGSHDTDQEL